MLDVNLPVFRVLFPVFAKEAPLRLEQTPQVTALPESGTVLLVDHNDMVRIMTAHVLTCMGVTVLKAGNGAEALDKC